MIFKFEIMKGLTLGELLITAVLLIAVLALSKLISIRLKKIFRDKLSKQQMGFMLKMLYYGIITIYIISMLTYFGVNFSGLLVAGGIAGIIIGFASQRIVGNMISGLFLLIERPVRIGSDVNVEGYGGFVEDINVFSTIIRTYDGVFVRLPNEKVFMANIINNVEHKARRVDFSIGIDYESDTEKALQVINEIVHQNALVLVFPTPEVYVDKLSESSVDIAVRLWSANETWWTMKKNILVEIYEALLEKGIVIPYPHLDVKLSN